MNPGVVEICDTLDNDCDGATDDDDIIADETPMQAATVTWMVTGMDKRLRSSWRVCQVRAL